MGFRSGSYATIWEVEPVRDNYTKGRISISHKDKQTGEYVNDFGSFVNFFGTAAAGKAAHLKPRDRIKLGDVDVNSNYVKEKNVTYYNFNIYSFDIPDRQSGPQTGGYAGDAEPDTSFLDIDSGEIEGELPF